MEWYRRRRRRWKKSDQDHVKGGCQKEGFLKHFAQC
jgi:hypothetical protein